MTASPPPPYDSNAAQPDWDKPSHPPKKPKTLWIFGSIGAIVAVGVIAAVAGGGPKDELPSIATSSSVETITAAPSTVTVQQTAVAPATRSAVATRGIMPTVVCMNLQDAQDLIQANGVFFSRSTDAMGEERMQLIDSNWVVVDQTPEPGAPITDGEAVLSVVTIGEPSGC